MYIHTYIHEYCTNQISPAAGYHFIQPAGAAFPSFATRVALVETVSGLWGSSGGKPG